MLTSSKKVSEFASEFVSESDTDSDTGVRFSSSPSPPNSETQCVSNSVLILY